MVNDIGKFYASKLHRLTVDVVDSCERMETDPQEAAMMVVSVLASELLTLVIHMEIEEKDFIKLCTVGYRKLDHG
jgi:hypothetical protein